MSLTVAGPDHHVIVVGIVVGGGAHDSSTSDPTKWLALCHQTGDVPPDGRDRLRGGLRQTNGHEGEDALDHVQGGPAGENLNCAQKLLVS